MRKADILGNPQLAGDGVINPYSDALRLFVSRLLWDVRPISHVMKSKIKKLKNSCSGKAIILCNGPSLNRVDFDVVNKAGVYTFGLNKINLLFSRTNFRPSSIVSVNPFVIEQNADYYNETDIPLFLDKAASKRLTIRDNVILFHCSNQKGGFARDCTGSLIQGYTVTYVAMQIAFHLGFDEVALVGCDHNFATTGVTNQLQKAEGEDKSHFDPSYFSGGDLWQLPDLMQSEYHYGVARQIFEGAGRRLVNCTEGGRLEVFERESLDDFLASGP